MAFSGVIYSTSNMPFSASLLTELFVWVLPRYSDFTPFCFKLITCFMKMEATASLLVKKKEKKRENHNEQSTKDIVLNIPNLPGLASGTEEGLQQQLSSL